MDIIYHDSSIAVCIKQPGQISEDKGENSVPNLLRSALGADYIGVVHRLDRSVGGVMVYALTQEAASRLSAEASDGTMKKEYAAVVRSVPEKSGGILTDLLLHDMRKNKSFVVSSKRRGVKEASLIYRHMAQASADCGVISLERIRLITGRTHQIRVQFASRGTPLVGDGRYGGKDAVKKEPALYCVRLSLVHPNGQRMDFTAPAPEGYPWNLFDSELILGDVDYEMQ
jgi:23S rRNA pseudouridine1911/1915/1917 synthase